jgi:N-dimethylarginine dimethylaminohydrolase
VSRNHHPIREELRVTQLISRSRHYLMCRPTHFAVEYAINPWMDPGLPVDRVRAVSQWETLRRTYTDLGHRVDTIEPLADLPDMVFAANGGLVIDGAAYTAQFHEPERAAEGPAYCAWFEQAGLGPVHVAKEINEGEGDLLVAGRFVLAGTGFRTSLAAHQEVQELFGRPVITLQLVDPRFYHLDTALSVLDERTLAYYPEAFSPGSAQVLRELFPDAILATAADAEVLGLNAVSDGRHVVLAEQAHGLHGRLARRGYTPIGVDMSELMKAGGGAKCCTLEIRA